MTHAGLNSHAAALRWPATAVPGAARLELPPGLRRSLYRGHNNPIIGWCSSGLGRRVPSFTLLGCGRSAAGEPFRTRLEFVDAEIREESAFTRSAVSWGTSNARGQEKRGN
jgi:hypothetical protein